MKKFNYFLPIFLQKIIYIIFFPLYKFFLRIEIHGKKNICGLTGPLILAPNHTSELDATAMPLTLPFFSKLTPIYSVIYPLSKYRADDFGWRGYIYGTRFLTWLGGYPVYSGYRSYTTSLDNHIKLLRKGRTVCIFPEGKCTLDGKMNPARGGLGYMVYTTGATVVPIAIDTFFNMSWRDFLTRQRKVIIKIGKPIKADKIIARNIDKEDLTVDDYHNASQIVLDKIKLMMD